MITVQNSFYKDYENLLIKNDKLSQEIRNLKYNENLLLRQIQTLENQEKQAQEKVEELQKENEELLKEKDYEISRLRALLNMDGTNHGIPTSMTPINKKKVIPNTREKSGKPRGGQIGHKKHKLKKFNDKEVNETISHEMQQCPCCNSNDIKETGEIKEKDELDYKLVVVKRRHKFVEYECKECGKILNETYQQRWIPVSEEPKEQGSYITTIKYGDKYAVGQRYYHGKYVGWEDSCVIAYMPLPEPYEAEMEGEG